MPGWSGAVGTNVFKSYGVVPSTSLGIKLTGASLINTKSAYIPMCESLDFNASGMFVFLTVQVATGGAATDSLVDIAVGDLGSEVDIISNLLISMNSRVEHQYVYNFDRLQIPAGSRLSTRYQGSNTGTSNDIILIPYMDDIADVLALGRVTTYGLIPGRSGGATVDPGGSANTLGAWTALVTSTLYDVRSMNIAIGSRTNAANTTQRQLVDIGIGAAGQEQVIFTFPMVAGTTNDSIAPTVIGPIHLNLPPGTRIAARAQSTINDATDRLFDMTLYCMD